MCQVNLLNLHLSHVPPPHYELCQAKLPPPAVISDDSGRTLTSSDFDLRVLQPDVRVEGLLRFSNPDDLDRHNQEARQANRHPELFALYPPADEVRTSAPPPPHLLRLLAVRRVAGLKVPCR